MDSATGSALESARFEAPEGISGDLVVRCELEHTLVVLACAGEVSLSLAAGTEVGEGGEVAGFEGERRLEGLAGFGDVAPLELRDAEVDQGRDITWVEL